MNPELHRNLWLEATSRRLALAGAVLAGVFVAVWLVDRGRHASALTTAGAATFAVAALGWGPRAARASVTAEVRAGTWDQQRLSALAPWSMTWGKLAGSTARPWAVGAGGLLIAGLQLASTDGLGPAAFWFLVAAGLGVALQASGLATGLIDVRRARASGRPLSARAPGLALLVLCAVALAGLVWLRSAVGGALGQLAPLLPGAGGTGPAPGGPTLRVGWFGGGYPPLGFAAASLVVAAGWAVVWAWRLMRLELAHANLPWAWWGFLACGGVYVFGFDPPASAADPVAVRLAACAGLWAALAYLAAFAGPADRVRARQFTGAFRDGRPGRMLTHLPLTVAPAVLALGAGAGVALLRARAGEAGAALLTLAALAVHRRDLGVIAWRRFAGRGRAGDGGVVAALAALYLAGAALGWLLLRGRGAALVWPSAPHPRLSLLAGSAEALVAWALAALAVSRPVRPPPAWADLQDEPPDPGAEPQGEPLAGPEPPATAVPVTPDPSPDPPAPSSGPWT